MQRRAAAIYAAFFLVLAAAAYGVVGLAEEPAVDVEDPERSLAAGDALQADGLSYTVGGIQPATNDAGDRRSASLRWVNESARYTVTFEHNGTVPAAAVWWPGKTNEVEPYVVIVEDAQDPSDFTLRQQFNVSGRLATDPAVEDETVTRTDGRTYVVYRANGTTRPLAEYLPEPERNEYTEGDTVSYRGNATRVATVSNESVTLAWTGPRTNSRSIEEGATITLDGTDYVAHFPDNSTLELSSDLTAYDRDVQALETYHERMNGLWGISIVSGLAAVLLLGAAYLPSRY